jgi:hypothetical protein
MSDKVGCPVCDSYTSNVAWAVHNGEPCPYCGTPSALIVQISQLRERRGDEQLRTELEQALIKLDQVTRARNHLARVVGEIRRTVLTSEIIELVDEALYPTR